MDCCWALLALDWDCQYMAFWQGIGVRIRSGYGTEVLRIEVGWWGIGGKDRIDMVGIWSAVGR